MTQIITRCRFFALLAVAFCLVLSGCSGKGKPSKANFEKVKEGMSPKEVEELMGPAKDTATVDPKAAIPGGGAGIPGMDLVGGMMGKITVKTWEEGDTSYVVQFKDDKMVTKVSGSKKDMEKEKGSKKEAPTSKVSKENFDKITKGMKKSEVEEILGAGKAKVDGGNIFVWTDGSKSITITFKNDKVEDVIKAGF
jgi:hypothetical protein